MASRSITAAARKPGLITSALIQAPFIAGFRSSSNNTTNHVPISRTRCAKTLSLPFGIFHWHLLSPICYLLLIPRSLSSPTRSDGRVAEWSNVPDSKSGDRAIGPWVRIPPLPRLNLRYLRESMGAKKMVPKYSECHQSAAKIYEICSLLIT